MTLDLIYKIIWFLIIVNTVVAMITIFRKPRNIASIFAWMMVLVLLPGIGFILYLFLGRGLDNQTIRRFQEEDNSEYTDKIVDAINGYNTTQAAKEFSESEKLLARYFNHLENAPLTKGNDVTLYYDGKDKFASLFDDIRAAKNNVHVEYYAIFNDKIGNQLLDILIDKAKEGIEVRVIYDPWGGDAKAKFFKPLEDVGGMVTPFITARDTIRKSRLNFHLHRKVVIVDGKIGWTGGFNVGDQYIYGSEKFGFWRDTHGRIVGTAAFSLQEVFIRDWNVSIANKEDYMERKPEYFVLPEAGEGGDVAIQVAADGPSNETEILRTGFIKMIMDAQDYIWIQSPYLIPDDSMITALLAAANSGVDVRIMIPDMPDHPFIYRATQYYANYLKKRGVKIYNYNNGFIHAKTLMMDDKIGVFGTTNQDIRSYSLNFEVSAFCYDEGVAKALKTQFEKDMKVSTELTDEIIAGQSWWLRFKQNFSRLLSPIL